MFGLSVPPNGLVCAIEQATGPTNLETAESQGDHDHAPIRRRLRPCPVGTCSRAAARSPQNCVQRLDQGWRFIAADPSGAEAETFDDRAWEPVSVPHSWNAADWQSPSYRRGPGWYRRTLTLPDDWAGKRVFLRFEAAGTSADVYVNGRAVGHHVGAFAAFCVEITEALRPGTPTVLAVRVSNAPRDDMPPLGGDFNLFGGLYRPVTIFARDPICISPLDHASPGVVARQLAGHGRSRADIAVDATLSNCHSGGR